MRVVIQRVSEASVSVDGEVVSRVGKGVVCLVGIHRDDTDTDAEYIANKILKTKLFSNEKGQPWKKGVADTDGEILLVSQFTLFMLLKGNNPDWHLAMKSELCKDFYAKFVDRVRESYIPEKVKDGVFGAMMDVSIRNDGPVTVVLDSRDRATKGVRGYSDATAAYSAGAGST